MNYSRMKIFTLFACSSLVFFLGCDNSKPDPAVQPSEGAVTQVVASATSSPNVSATNAPVADAASAPVPAKQPVEPEINGIAIKGLRTITVKASDTPDLEAFLDYVKVEPNPGPITIDFYPWNKTVYLNADYQPRTEYHVTVKAGLPFADGRKTKHESQETGPRPSSSQPAAATCPRPAGAPSPSRR